MFGILLSESPWGILSGSNSVQNFGKTIQLANLGRVMQRGAIGFCFVAIAICVVKLLIFHDQKGRSEIKSNIEHKIVVIALAASLVTLFALMKSVFDTTLFNAAGG